MATDHPDCSYCAEGALVDAFGIKICELAASKVYLFKEQSHRGRVIVASKHHVSEMVDLSRADRQAFLDDVALVAKALHDIFKPAKINYGAYGDTGCHLHFHLVPKYRDDEFEWGGVFAMNPKRKFLAPAEYDDMVREIAAALLFPEGVDLRIALTKLRDEIKADGKLDYGESSLLVKVLPRLGDGDARVARLASALANIRVDGVITPSESASVLSLLDDILY